MVKTKIVGTVGPDQANFYCDVGTVQTNRVSYGVQKTVNSKVKQLVKKRRRTIGTSPAGKEVFILPCSEREVCPNRPVKEDDIDAVKIFCPTAKPVNNCPACVN